MQEPWYWKNCIKQILPFSELSDSQLCRVTKENLKSTPKKIIQDNNLVFLNDQYGTAIKNDSFTPDEFYKNLKTISPTYNLVIHIFPHFSTTVMILGILSKPVQINPK